MNCTEDVDYRSARRVFLHAGLVLLPLLGIGWAFAILSINEELKAFHYLFAISACLQGIFLLLAYVVFSRNVSQSIYKSLSEMDMLKIWLKHVKRIEWICIGIYRLQTRQQLKYQFARMKGKADLDDSLNGTRASMLSVSYSITSLQSLAS